MTLKEILADQSIGVILDRLISTEADRSFSDRCKLIQAAIRDKMKAANGGYSSYCYVCDVFDTFFVYSTDDEYWQLDYSIGADGAVSFGATPIEVLPTMTYPLAPAETPTLEAALVEMELIGEIIPLCESATTLSFHSDLGNPAHLFLQESGSGLAKLIDPGWGSSGYYPAAVLERDGPSIFKAGTQMFWNHQTPAQEAAQPEGDLNTLAGVLKEDARWIKDGPKGSGLYAPVTVFDKFHGAVKEMAPHIGLSIRASGMGRKDGEAEGRKGPVVEKLVSAKSVDYVTRAGRGGEIITMFEAAGRQAPPANPQREEQIDMNAEELKALQESVAASKSETRALRVRLALAEGKEYASSILAGITMPEACRSVLLERLVPKAAINEAGELDTAAFKPIIIAEATREVEYVTKLQGSGQVRNMGSGGTPVTEADQPKPEELQKQLASNLQRLGGLTEAGAAAAARGRRFVA